MTKRGIAIITGIVKTATVHEVNQTFTKKELNQLLTLFDHHPSDDDLEYALPHKLVLWTYRERNEVGDSETAETIRKVFPWFKPKGEIDEELLL